MSLQTFFINALFVLSLSLSTALVFAEDTTRTPHTLNQCSGYLTGKTLADPLSPEARLQSDLRNYLLPNAPLEMPQQILTWQETRILMALSEDTLTNLEKELKESQILFSDYFNFFAEPTVVAPAHFQKATPEEIRMIAEYIYNSMKKDLEFATNLNLYLLDDLYMTQKVFYLTPKEKMITLIGYNLVFIGGAQKFVTYKNHKTLIKSLRQWLRGL